MALFPQRFIDDLRLQANIVEIVQEYVPLRRAGATYKGLCPFHSEKTPSFHVNPEKGFFHCFGCGAGGDVFKFLELHEKLEFPEAVRHLAQRLGLTLPEPDENTGEDARGDAALRESLLRAHEAAAAYFREQLAGPAGARARQQLSQRDVDGRTVEQLGLGYASPSRDGLKNRLLQQGFSAGLLVQSGLVVQRETEQVDRFRNRLMIPICRDSGPVIAFAGRSIEPDQPPKYLNSPETPIYSKGRTLYGLNLTRTAVRKLGYAVLVEGYFDFAQVFKTDAAPAVASCGTALTLQQAQLLRRFTSRVVLSFDPDTAGQTATARSCELLVQQGFDVNVVMLDKGEDPDTFIRRHGAERYRERLRSSRPYLEYLLDQAGRRLDLRQDRQKRAFLESMLPIVNLLSTDAARDQFAERVAFKAGITDEVVRSAFRKVAVRRQPSLSNADLPSLGEPKKFEKALIWWLVQRPADTLPVLGTLEEADFETSAAREIFEVARSLHSEPPELVPAALIQRLSTGSARLVTGIGSEPAPPANRVAECVQVMRQQRLGRESAAIQREIDRLQELGAELHGDEINALWQRKIELLHRIEELA
jgi:DNA primase